MSSQPDASRVLRALASTVSVTASSPGAAGGAGGRQGLGLRVFFARAPGPERRC